MPDEFNADAFRALSQRLYKAVFERIDLERLQKSTGDQFRRELALLNERILDDENFPVNQAERRRLVQDIQNELIGLGPIEPLMLDPSVSDILVNSYRQVYVERKGQLQLTPVQLHDDKHVPHVIENIVSRVGRRIDESSPMPVCRIVRVSIPSLTLGARRPRIVDTTFFSATADHERSGIAELLEVLAPEFTRGSSAERY